MSTKTLPYQQSPQDDLINDEEILRQLGYTQQLHRRMGLFGNFAMSLVVIAVMAGTVMLLGYGLNTGGPATLMWVWLAAGPLMLCMAAALAELTSRYPTSGGLYFMAHQLGGKRWGWYTGWLNLLGMIAGAATVAYGISIFVGAWLNLQWGFQSTPKSLFAIFTGVLLVQAVLNLFSVRVMNALSSFGAWWIMLGTIIIVGALVALPSHHQPAGFVFAEFTNNTGWGNPLYVVLLASLGPAFALFGCDTSAHLSEETSQAPVAAARGMVRSVAVAWIASVALLAGLLFAVQDYAKTLSSEVAVVDILLDAVGLPVAKALLVIIIVTQMLCGYALLGASSRVAYAFSRDGALPGSSLWCRISPRTATPNNATWLATVVGFVVVLPSLYSTTAFTAVTAVSTVGWIPSYAIPVFLRLRHPERFTPGPWTLGRWSGPVSWIAVVWGAVVTVMALLPQLSPVTVSNFNYAPVTLLAVLALAAVWWQVQRRSYDVPASTSSASDQISQARDII